MTYTYRPYELDPTAPAHTLESKLTGVNPAIRQRQSLEFRIVSSAVHELLAANTSFAISVDDGDDDHVVKRSRDPREILAAVMHTDEDYLLIHAHPQYNEAFGWIRLIYGEDGWDVICDYTTNLEVWLPLTLAYIDREMHNHTRPNGTRDHERDEECILSADLSHCVECGVSHANPCDVCKGAGYHRKGCTVIDGEVR